MNKCIIPMRLQSLVSDYAKQNRIWFKVLSNSDSICMNDIEVLQDEVLNDLCETGLQSTNEPNAKGMLLEELIDWLSGVGRSIT